MRRLIVSTIISADGYHEGPGKNVMALPFDAGFSAYNVERLRAAETLLLGRRSFEGFRDYWPKIEHDAGQDAIEREISRRNNAIAKIVVSDSLTPEQAGPWKDTTRIVGRARAVEVARELRRGAGDDILVFGSRTMWNDLLIAGQIDELHLMIGPALLGAGTSIYGGSTPAPLRLLEARTLDGSSLILARYAPLPVSDGEFSK